MKGVIIMKKGLFTKAISIAVTSILAVSMITGCSSSGDNSSTSSSPVSSGASSSSGGETSDISWPEKPIELMVPTMPVEILILTEEFLQNI